MNRIRELRKDSDLTLKEFGLKIGVAESTLSLYETGRREPDYTTLIKIADFFRVSTDYILCRGEITQEEREAGWRDTKKIDVTPDEEDLIYWFRDIGKLYGKEMQQAQLTMFKNLAENKK